ncbi:MAG: hypothetical protein KAH67_07155 [Flavobacteriaceae bacterium]|nr:hypothetical protein [Flavobacteriaceae bacterium]
MKNIISLNNIKNKSLILKSLKPRFFRIGIFVAFFFFSFVGFSQVTIKTDTTKIRIGEQIQYEIIVNETDDVQFSKLQLDNLKKVEVVQSFKIDSLKNRLIKKYAITSFDSGRWVLPRQKVLIKNKSFLTDSVIIDVATVPVDTIKQPMYPIKTIKNEPYTFRDYQKYFWGSLLLLLIIGLILYFVLRKKPTPEEIIAKIPPFDLAKQRLIELDDKKLLKQNKVKRYYVELTDIVRSFIEREMNIPALESTTDELLETITDFNNSSSLNIPKETLLKLQRLLQEADLVKFAKSKPLLNEIELHRNDAETIIDNLHPDSDLDQEEEIDKEKEDGK